MGLQEELSAVDPQNLLARLELGKLKLTAAPATENAGNRARAIRYLQDAAAIFQAALQRDPSNDDARFHLGWAWANLGDVYMRWGGPARAQALPCFERAADVLRGMKLAGRPDGGLDPKALIAHVSDVLDKRRGHRE
jgi:tetratricopeptide (TPR) repeat protein